MGERNRGVSYGGNEETFWIDHFREVTKMLKRQKRRPVFSGGLEPEYMTPWKAEQLMSVRPQTMYTAYDTMDDADFWAGKG